MSSDRKFEKNPQYPNRPEQNPASKPAANPSNPYHKEQKKNPSHWQK